MIRPPPRSTLFPYPPLFRSYREIGAELARGLAFFRRADGGDDFRPEGFRELDGGGADARGAAMHQKRLAAFQPAADRKSTRLNSSHANISYAVFCLKKHTTL